MSVLTARNVPKKDPKELKPTYNQADAIPPELLVRRDNTVRYEKDGPIYATDGKVGTLKKVVVDEASAEVSEIIIAVDGSDQAIVLPADVVDRSAGAALFISLNRVQFAERVSAGPQYARNHFAKADLKSLMHGKDGTPPDARSPVGHQRRTGFRGDAAGLAAGSAQAADAGRLRRRGLTVPVHTPPCDTGAVPQFVNLGCGDICSPVRMLDEARAHESLPKLRRPES